MNEYRVVVDTEPLRYRGEDYAVGDMITMPADDCAPLVVLGKVRLTTTPAPPAKAPPKRRQTRPRKDDTIAPSYRRRDLRADP